MTVDFVLQKKTNLFYKQDLCLLENSIFLQKRADNVESLVGKEMPIFSYRVATFSRLLKNYRSLLQKSTTKETYIP